MTAKSTRSLTYDECIRIMPELIWLLEECENKSTFRNTRARRFLSVGEQELMFESLYKFVEGNEEFKSGLGTRYADMVKFFSDFVEYDRITPRQWSG